MIEYIGIIPARYASSRFPGKVLCDLLGKPMIQRVYEAVFEWGKWERLVVATDSDIVANVCRDFNIEYIITQPTHQDCLDRAAEVALNIKGDKYIIVQGDEPCFDSAILDSDLSADVTNFYTEVKLESEIFDPDVVKVVISRNSKAIYFSRYSVPYRERRTRRGDKTCPVDIMKQIGVYAFSRESLLQFGTLTSSLERYEGIGLLRLIDNDVPIQMNYFSKDFISVDTPDDVSRVIEQISESHELELPP